MGNVIRSKRKKRSGIASNLATGHAALGNADKVTDADAGEWVKADGVIRGIGYAFSFRDETRGFAGGIWLLWKSSLQLDIIPVTNQFVHLAMRAPTSPFLWVIGGDFNGIVSHEERKGGSILISALSQHFIKFLFGMGLHDLSFPAPHSRGVVGTFIKDWIDVLVMSTGDRVVDGEWPFWFLAASQQRPEFEEFLRGTWYSSQGIVQNIERFTNAVKPWNRDVFGHLGKHYPIRSMFNHVVHKEMDVLRASGLTQCDPLPLYLFVLCIERLAQAITQEVSEGQWAPIKLSRRGPRVPLPFFADDLALFMEASMPQMRILKRCSISAELGFLVVDDFGKYLGVPLLHRRIMLAKAVLAVIPLSTMQPTVVPKGVCLEMGKIIRNFVCGHPEDE
ncbi:hypothetical protein GOBAR_DD22801 [Gossypium barbadense]|nr:hypothetical protein GOBAR_DD22801 [Gossypium barbadense]